MKAREQQQRKADKASLTVINGSVAGAPCLMFMLIRRQESGQNERDGEGAESEKSRFLSLDYYRYMHHVGRVTLERNPNPLRRLGMYFMQRKPEKNHLRLRKFQ